MALISHAAEPPQLQSPAPAGACTIDWSKFLDRPVFTSGCFECDAGVAGKTVLITGAGGSIGSALAHRLMGSLAGTLLLLDRSQQNLHALHQEYRGRNATLPRIEFFQADILSLGDLRPIFSKYRPHIVFHAAAMKHLAPLEYAPFVALENNVLGTARLLRAADSSELEYFINISTDKAVNPTSVLGVSKRIAELLLLATESAVPHRLSLRLGNVLGSSGSVVPAFMRCLEENRPLEITDVHASRYFITREEVVTFLMKTLQVPAISLLLPDMGGQRRIMDLAAFLLNEFQCNVRDKSPTLTGLRDGEKCCEQLTYSYEYLIETRAPHIHRICGSTIPEGFAGNLGRLSDLVAGRRTSGLLDALAAMVPEFTPSPALLRYVH